MSLSGNNNLLLSDSHFHNAQPQRRRHYLVPETPNTHSFHHIPSSAQSIQAMLSLPPPLTSTSYPYLQQLVVKPSSTPAISSSLLCKDPTANTGFYHLNNLCLPTHISISESIARDEMINKSSDENTGSTYLSNKNLNEKHELIEIRVRCIFLRVGEIDTLNERYTGEIFF
ncbi:unnamed protein product [Rotaria sp. Silwood2]|nr:unnamed protein product [Rotaria sp. Silwood2]CAF2558583.1 unnamed protein product [Rotaria sp. Silwood2]CAF2820169.1 unnamed protein product [Rotaria sp. Silwood2]CAF2981352.1 unnamed protein product [Rotaria sp. Silwood2]CAF4413702.1 unnamed protein product [Rotaria sp. Silwood2]